MGERILVDYCQNCAFWRAGGAAIATTMDGRDPAGVDGLGTCHLYPPAVVVIEPGHVASAWPQTRENDACSDWTGIAEIEVIQPGAHDDGVVVPFERPTA